MLSKGVTLVELMLAVTVLGLIVGAVVITVDPFAQRGRARDSRRIADLVILTSAIERYSADHGGTPPDISGALRTSRDAALAAVPGLSDGRGWIATDLSSYVEKLPTDPLNDDRSYYRYMRVGQQYELDAALELLTSISDNRYDGGNRQSHYEVGSNLTLLD